jgi:hypothetical protein
MSRGENGFSTGGKVGEVVCFVKGRNIFEI